MTPRADQYAVSGKDKALTYPLPSTCEQYGEHQGDPYEQTDVYGVVWENWTCCDASEASGEIHDCDVCGDPGICAEGDDLPPGWIEDTNGRHCPKCYPKEWLDE